MPETQAVSSPAEAVDPFNGQSPTLREFNSYRVSGEVPARFMPEEAAPAAAEPAEGEEPETEPEAAPDEDQAPEGIGNKARKRFEKLLAEKKELERKLAAKPDAQPAPSAAQPLTRPEPTVEDRKPDGTLKYADYADFIKDLGKWSAEQTLHEAQVRQSQQKNFEEVQEKVERDRKRYGEEFGKIIEPTAADIMGNASIPMEVKRMLAKSDILPDLVYTLGTDKNTLQKLVQLAKTDPQSAMYYLAELSADIRQELAKPDETQAPEPKKTTAPKPPSPVTGASSRAFDVSDESLSADDWVRKRNQQLARRGT